MHTETTQPPLCPECHGELRLLSAGHLGSRRFRGEFFAYSCPQHGTVFHTREGIRQGPESSDEAGPAVRSPLDPRRPPRSAASADPGQ